MDFQLSEEQLALRTAARGFIADQWSPDQARQALDQPPACLPAEVLAQIVEMGWIGIASPLEVGGSGGDIVTAAVLAEEAGRGLLPGPFRSAMAAAIAVDGCHGPGHRELLTDLVSGTKRATLAIQQSDCGGASNGVSCSSSRTDDEWVLNGLKIIVPDAAEADVILVAAQGPVGAGLWGVPAETAGVEINSMRCLDARQISEIRLDDVVVDPDSMLAGPEGAQQTLRHAHLVTAALEAADLLGTAQRVLEITTDFAKERVQFGRPIGGFQAVSHRLADVHSDVEIARGLVYGACLAIDDEDPKAPALVSAAKAWSSDTAVEAAEAALQLHGGIGYTWEYDVHLFLRRARVGAVTCGGADWHRDRIAHYLDQLHLDEGETSK